MLNGITKAVTEESSVGKMVVGILLIMKLRQCLEAERLSFPHFKCSTF